MPPEKIKVQVKNIDAAAREIIGVLEDTSKGNVIYFKGWAGLGTSAVLNLVAQRLRSSTRQNKFDKVIHVDCSVWKSMRSLQKAIAEELLLPRSVMAIFDWCEEEDDFNGMDQGSRGVIADIRVEIFRKLYKSRFVVVFHNGSSRYIDLYECGVPVLSLLSNKVLWTWHGRFRICPGLEDAEKLKMRSHTDVRMHAYLEREHEHELLDLLHEEALEVAKGAGIVQPNHIKHKIVMECFIYRYLIAMDLKTHAPNYWICDGIIEGQDNNTSAWEIGNSLQRNMSLDWDWDLELDGSDAYSLQVPNDLLVNRWNFTTHEQLLKDNTRVLPPQVTSFFLSGDKPPRNTWQPPEPPHADKPSTLPVRLFQYSQSSKLRVLHLSHCTFSFASPPFVHCAQLRLLHLDHCMNTTDGNEHPSHNENMPCFQKLWVLDLRYTKWYWLLSERMKRLMVELRELNVEGVEHGCIRDLGCGRPSLVILRVTAYPIPTDNEVIGPVLISNTNRLMTQLESFSFINKARIAAQIFRISFRGCSRLKSILLRGNLWSLVELDLSGTAVKTLDLREVEAPYLESVILLGCDKLYAILWPQRNERTRRLTVLHINTIRSALPNQANSKEFIDTWYIAVRDARLLRCLQPIEDFFPRGCIYMEMNSSPASKVAGGSEVSQRIVDIHQPDHSSYARDVVFQGHLQAGAGNEGTICCVWACPPRPAPQYADWYVHIQDEHEMKWGLLQQEHNSIEGTTTGSATLPPSFVFDKVRMLHVHDSSSITCIPWPQDTSLFSFREGIEWCRVERCPNLSSVFATLPRNDGRIIFVNLSTFWASQLPRACYIWNWTQANMFSFSNLSFLHLDCCPRLIHVLPLSEGMDTLPSLETLEIVCCGDLKEVFPLDHKRQEKQEVIRFPNLSRIHLYQLSSLQSICGSRMSALNLETFRIRGCWSLRRLPSVSSSTTKRPKVDCKKDWWDNLEWDGVEANHDPSLYETSHSRYYKKAHLPRGTVLR